MKKMIAATLLVGAAALIAIPAMAGTCPAPQCSIQTKAKSKTAGKTDYKVSCIEQSSGDEIISSVTAASDKEAKNLASKKC
jgi:hypothetical protein